MNIWVVLLFFAGLIVGVVVVSNLSKEAAGAVVELTCTDEVVIAPIQGGPAAFQYSASNFQTTPQVLSFYSYDAGDTLLSSELFDGGSGNYAPPEGTAQVRALYQCLPFLSDKKCDDSTVILENRYEVVSYVNNSASLMEIVALEDGVGISETVAGFEQSTNFVGFSTYSFACIGPNTQTRALSCPQGKGGSLGALSLTDGAVIPVSNTFHLPISVLQSPYGGGKADAFQLAAGSFSFVDGAVYESFQYSCPDITTLTCEVPDAQYLPPFNGYLKSIVPKTIGGSFFTGEIDTFDEILPNTYVGGSNPVFFADMHSFSLQGCPSLSILNCDVTSGESGNWDGDFGVDFYIFNAGLETSVSGNIFGNPSIPFVLPPQTYLSVSYAYNVGDGGSYVCPN